jgi:hypothetical protein
MWLFLDAYSLTDRRVILPALRQCKLLTAQRIRYWPLTAAQAAGALEAGTRKLCWPEALSSRLERRL